jgi:hypothetical protein
MTSTRKNQNKRNKTSKRVLEMWKDPNSVWGKNKPLEKFWRDLASGKKVVVIYKNGTHKYVTLPSASSAGTKKSTTLFNNLDANPEVTAVLSSSLSQDAYEVYLYPKAKDSSVESVIKHYKKYFKTMGPITNGLEGTPLMKKVKVPM